MANNKRRRKRSPDKKMEEIWKEDMQYNIYMNMLRAKLYEERMRLDMLRIARREHFKYVA